MMRGIFERLSIGSQLLMVIFIGLFSQSIVLMSLSAWPNSLEWTMVRQFINMLVVFFLPPLLLMRWRGENAIETWKLLPNKNVYYWLVALFGITLILPAADYLSSYIKGIENVPEWWASQRELQKSSEAFIENMLTASPTIQFASFFTLVILPPLAEEFFFRGTVQRLLYRSMPAWASIIITALFFSAAHLQIDNALSIFLLALALGWMYHRTHQLWMPILAHMLFNGISYFTSIQSFEMPQSGVFIIVTAFFGILLLFRLKDSHESWRPIQAKTDKQE